MSDIKMTETMPVGNRHACSLRNFYLLALTLSAFVILLFCLPLQAQDSVISTSGTNGAPEIEIKISGSKTDKDVAIKPCPISGKLSKFEAEPKGSFYIHVIPANYSVTVRLDVENIDNNENGKFGSIRLEENEFTFSGTQEVVFEPVNRSDERDDIRVVARLAGDDKVCASQTLTVFEFNPRLEHSFVDSLPSNNLISFVGDLYEPYSDVMVAGGKNSGIRAFGIKDRWILPDETGMGKGGTSAAAYYLRRGTMSVLAETPREGFLVASGKSPEEVDELNAFLKPIETSTRMTGSVLIIDTIPEYVFEGNIKASISLNQKTEGKLRVFADTTDIPRGSDTETARHTVNVASTATSMSAKVLSVGGMMFGPAVSATAASVKSVMGGDVYSRAEAEAYISVKSLRDGELKDFSSPIVLGEVRDKPSHLHAACEISPRTLGGFDVPFIKVPGLETEEKKESIDWALRFDVGGDNPQEAVLAHIGSNPTKFLVYSGLHVLVIRGNNECEADAFLTTEPIEANLVVYEWQ